MGFSIFVKRKKVKSKGFNGKGLIQKGYYSKGNPVRAAIEAIISHLKADFR
jgi:hypothetical protein